MRALPTATGAAAACRFFKLIIFEKFETKFLSLFSDKNYIYNSLKVAIFDTTYVFRFNKIKGTEWYLFFRLKLFTIIRPNYQKFDLFNLTFLIINTSRYLNELFVLALALINKNSL